MAALFEIQKESTPEEAEESEPKEGTMMIAKLTEGLDTGSCNHNV